MTQTGTRKNFAFHFWDFLAWVTVLFPLFTGGVWIRRPHFFFELSQINGPVIALTIFALLLARKRINVEETSSMRLLLRLWENWKSYFQKDAERTVWLSWIFVGFLWGLVGCERHWGYQSGYADLGIFDNAIWNLTHGYGYISSVKGGMNLLSDHQSPIFFLMAPLYKVFPHPETLLMAQGFGLALSAVALFYIARQYMGAKHALLPFVPLAAWAYFPIRNANRFDFHPEIFMLPTFLFAIAGLQSKQIKNISLGVCAFVLGLAAKESAGPVAAGIGLAWVLGAAPETTRARMRKVGIAVFVAGVAAFYFDLKIIPRWFALDYQYQNAFAQFGPNLKDLLFAPILQPRLFFQTIFAGSRIKFFLQTVAPLAFLPLFSPRTFLAALPGYLIIFLSYGDHRVNIGYHYAIESAVGVFWSFAPGILAGERLLKKWRPRWNTKKVLAYFIIFCALVGYGRSEGFFIRFYTKSPHHHWLEKEVFPLINDRVKLAATGEFVPHLTQRHWAHHLPIIWLPNEPGKYVDCIFWSKNPEVNNTPLDGPTTQAMEASMRKERYELVYACQGLEVWQHPHAPASCLVKKPSCY